MCSSDLAGTVFIDNVYFYKASEVKLPIRFNQEERFAGVGGASVELSTDPTDSSNNTAKVTNGGNDWETAEIMLDVPISITSGGDNKYSVRIYSPDDAEHSLMMKLEESGDNEYIELRQDEVDGYQLKRELAKLDRSHVSIVPRILNSMRIYSNETRGGLALFRR